MTDYGDATKEEIIEVSRRKSKELLKLIKWLEERAQTAEEKYAALEQLWREEKAGRELAEALLRKVRENKS